MKKVLIIVAIVVVLGAVYFVMQSRPESETPTAGMPVPGFNVSDTEVTIDMPVPGSNAPEMIVQ